MSMQKPAERNEQLPEFTLAAQINCMHDSMIYGLHVHTLVVSFLRIMAHLHICSNHTLTCYTSCSAHRNTLKANLIIIFSSFLFVGEDKHFSFQPKAHKVRYNYI